MVTNRSILEQDAELLTVSRVGTCTADYFQFLYSGSGTMPHPLAITEPAQTTAGPRQHDTAEWRAT